MQYFIEYNHSNSRKNQIDNVDIMNAFCKTKFLPSYSFKTSWIFMCLFLELCV